MAGGDEFNIAWDRFHPTSRPLGWLLRQNTVENWVRFHSLPESKRYAESDAEMRVVLHRANTLANEALGPNQPCFLVQSSFLAAEPAEAPPEGWLLPGSRPLEDSLAPARRFADPEEDGTWEAHAGQTVWQAGFFDALLSDVAENRALPTLWMSCSTGAVFAPYDGGVDLFLPTPSDVAALRGRYGQWLSAHPEGL